MRWIAAIIMALTFGLFCARAEEAGLFSEGPLGAPTADRDRLARGIFRHDFENRRDPDTGGVLPESADMDNNGWPDFWEPIRAVGYPEYLLSTVGIVADPSRHIPGAYRDVENRALRIGFDGTRVGLRTRMPVPVDPDLAYEFSLLHKASDMAGGRIRAGIDWMRIDPAASLVLRSDEIPDLDTGQADWPVSPRTMVVNDPPPTANAARLFVAVDRRPDSIGGAYHGTVWLDDIALRPLPRILVSPPRRRDDGAGLIIPVRFSGLFDNLPDPANPGFYRGKRYNRRVEVTDVFNQPLDLGLGDRRPIESGDDGVAVEEIVFPRARFGVYYFNVRLYDADDRLATGVMRSVAVIPSPPEDVPLAVRSGKPAFGVTTGSAPEAILARPGMLRDILRHAGARATRIVPWPDDYDRPGGNERYYRLLLDAVRGLRSAGVHLIGGVAPPRAMFGHGDLARDAAGDGRRLREIIAEAGGRLGLFVDGWQWGGDGDGSLFGMPPGAVTDGLADSLAEYAGGLPVTLTRVLGRNAGSGFPLRADIVNAFLPDALPVDRLWPAAARVFPWLFEPFYQTRGARYPPERLAALAPAPPADAVERQARESRRAGSAVSVELAPANPHSPEAAGERVQMERMLKRAVLAAAVAPDTVFLGALFGGERGLLRQDAMGGVMLETMARPAFLAAATASRLLEGAEYLGEIGLLPPFEAHAFRRPGTDQAVIALWHNAAVETRPLPRAEIATGPPLFLTDWAGNVDPLPASIPVRRTPLFITGLPASLVLTRMSVRIVPEPPMLATTRRQSQFLEVVNHMPRQTPVLFRLRYAARPPEGAMENGWTVSPEEIRINLQSVTPEFAPGRMRFSASPDPNSQIQIASPNDADKSGLKIARATMSVQSSPAADMLLYLPFRLRSEFDVDIERLRRDDDPNFVTLQLKIRWFPSAAGRRRGETRLVASHVKMGSLRETLPFPVTVKALPADARDMADAPYESVEIRIPRLPRAKTWVGLSEEGGGGFYIADVTGLLAE